MGQHKYNPMTNLAKENKIEPKKKGMSKRESERIIYGEIERRTGFNSMLNAMDIDRRY